jgi:BMFP domain-containing protein YqiC
MPSDNRLFDDLSRIAAGAFSAAAGVREEVELRLKEQMERFLARLDLVKREEFEAVKAMAALARSEQEALALKVSALEAQLATLVPGHSPAGETDA